MAVPAAPVAGRISFAASVVPGTFAKGLIRDLGEAGTSWLPTTSSRSLYCATSRDMIKFSLSVRLTNSVRTLSVKEVERGMRLARLAQTDGWQMLQARFPTFRVMQEDGWAGLRDLNGNIMQESLFSCVKTCCWSSRKARPTFWFP